MKDCEVCLCNTCKRKDDYTRCGGCEQCKQNNKDNRIIRECPDYQKDLNCIDCIHWHGWKCEGECKSCADFKNFVLKEVDHGHKRDCKDND